ncbi:PilN domain-containing protein [Pseudomonas sp. JDS28PS106]|uniref:PilN domain-containing protein n=1 Tax=Pseudomonas sp. JDS28PS106 TaxID=2497235 RepID=UPI002FD4DC07
MIGRLWRERLRARWQGSPAQAFLRAWGHELLAGLPAGVRRRLRPNADPPHLDWPLPETLATGMHGVLMLPAADVLVQRLALPTAVARDVRQVLHFELDRFTPFTPDQVYYTARREGITDQRLWVTLALVRREVLDACLEQCAARDLVLDGVDVRDAQGKPMGLDLLPHTYTVRRADRPARLILGLSLTCAAMVAAMPLLWIHNREAALAAMQSDVQGLRRQAAEVSASRTARGEDREALRRLTERRLGQPPRAQLLGELTQCLPNDAWLQSLEIRADGQLDMGGMSVRASALIGDIKRCAHLTDAQFQGVIQPDLASGRERFYLRARVRGEAGDAAPADPT